MVKCIVTGCESRTKSRNSRIPGVTFHRFPRDERRRSIWAYNLRLLSDPIRSRGLVCSRHFESSCYRNSTKVRRLLPHAYPTKLLGSTVNNMDSEDTASAPELTLGEYQAEQDMSTESEPATDNVQQVPVENTVNGPNTKPQQSPSTKSTESDSSSSANSSCPEDCPHRDNGSKSTLDVVKKASPPEENGNVMVYQIEHFKRSLYIQKLKNRLNRAKLRNLKKCEKIRHLKYKVEKYKSKCQNLQYQSTSSTSAQPNGFSYCVSGYYGSSGFGN